MKPQKRNFKVKPKKRLVVYDKLKFDSRNDEARHTKWRGDNGVYLVKTAEVRGPHSPVAQVFLNRVYMTGLFRTKDPGTFSADLKDEFTGNRRYLVFKKESETELAIYEKV